MDQKRKLGELISMNSELPGIIHIIEGEKITIGRDQANTNCIDDDRIAQFHCSIFFQDGQVVLKNLCQQGTFINKEKMGLDMEVDLKHGDHIHLLCLRSKKATEKNVIAYMFIKYEYKKQSARKQSKCQQPIVEQIGNNLDCIICSEMLYEGVAVSPCGHVFCGYCLEEWEQRKNTCPICRVKMRNITKAFLINKIINTLQEQNPDLELKPKPQNKYYLQAAQNYEDSESESVYDSDYSEIDSEIEEEEIIEGRQINELRPRQNNNIAGVQALNNQQFIQQNQQEVRNPQPVLPQARQQGPVNQRVDQAQNPLLLNGQAMNAQGNQQRVILQNPAQHPQVNQQRVQNPPQRQNVNDQRPPINAQANQQRVALPNQQNEQLIQQRPNVPPPVGQANQQRENPPAPMNQAVQQNQQRANPPPPIMVAQQNGFVVHAIAHNIQQNQVEFDQIQVRININPPPLQNEQVPFPQNVRQVFQPQPQQAQGNILQVFIQQPAQYQNQQPQIIQQQQLRNQNQPLQRNKECKSCNEEFNGFKCQPFAQHKYCYCQTKMPSRNLNIYQNSYLKLFCQVCKSQFCKYYYAQICEQRHYCDIKELNSYRDVFSYQNNYFNNVERARIQLHLGQRDQTYILDYMMQQHISKEEFYFQKNKALFQNVRNDVNELLLPNSPVCTNCIRDVNNQIIFRYVQSLQYNDEQFTKFECWYGINCRRQNEEHHAKSFNHICKQTKFD